MLDKYQKMPMWEEENVSERTRRERKRGKLDKERERERMSKINRELEIENKK